MEEKGIRLEPQIDSPWLKEGGLGVLDALEELGCRKDVPKGAILYQVGDPVTCLYYLLKGQVKIFITNDLGDEKTMSVVEAGNFFGEAAFLDNNARFASASTMTDCQVLALDTNDLEGLFKKSPETIKLMFKSICRKMRLMVIQIEDMTFWSTEKRLCRFLLKLLGDFSVQTDKGLALSISITDDQLGQHIGARREAVTKALGRLRSKGLVIKEKRRLYFPDLSLFKDYI